MHNSKLVKAISLLNAWELRHLSDFVHSPFFNKHDRLTALMDLLIAAAPEFLPEKLERNFVYQEIFQNGPFEEQKFKDLLSLGMKILKSFLSYYHIRQDDFTQNISLLEEMSERKWEAEFSKTLKLSTQSAENQAGQLQEIALRQLRLQELIISNQKGATKRKADDTIQVAADLLDSYYLLARLKYAVEMANRRNVIGQEFDQGMLKPLLSYIAENPALLAEKPAIQIYLLIYNSLIQPEQTTHFQALQPLLTKYVSHFPQAERSEIYAYALNFCIQQINRGKNEFLATLLELYQGALDDETLLKDGWLSQWDYKNIVTAGLKARNFEWCAKFIEQYKEKIEPNARENAHTYNLASLLYEQGEYRQSLKLLQHVEFTDVFYHLGSKVLLLKAYFETGDWEALIHLCETFRMYLKRNTGLSKYHFTINMNLISLTRKLADLYSRWPGFGSKDKAFQRVKIETAIKEKENVAQKVWLLEKVERLG